MLRLNLVDYFFDNAYLIITTCSQPEAHRKKGKKRVCKERAQLICRRISDSVALTNELWKAVGKDWCRGNGRKKESTTRRAKKSDARGTGTR